MRPLDQLLDDLARGFHEALPEDQAQAMSITDASVELPIDARLRSDGMQVSPPRGLWASGFDRPHSRIRATWALPLGAEALPPPRRSR